MENKPWSEKTKAEKRAHHAAMEMLYGNPTSQQVINFKADIKPKVERKKDPLPEAPSEAEEQIKLVVWLEKQGLRVVGSANGGKRHLFEAVKLKRMGLATGFPDIFVPLASGGYHGLMIEMKKAKGGALSAAQRDWLNYLRSQKYYAECAHGFEEAREMVLKYLSLTPKAA